MTISNSHCSESQEYNLIGRLAPEAEAAVADRKGWAGDPAETLVAERMDHTFSYWNKISNRQDLAAGGKSNYAETLTPPNVIMATPVGHDTALTGGPTAAARPIPFATSDSTEMPDDQARPR